MRRAEGGAEFPPPGCHGRARAGRRPPRLANPHGRDLVYALTSLAGNAETNPRASLIVGILCVAAIFGLVAWISMRGRGE